MPSAASSGIASSASSATFWPRDGEQVAEPGAAEVFRRPRRRSPRPRRARSRAPAPPRAAASPARAPSSARSRISPLWASASDDQRPRSRAGPAAAGAASARSRLGLQPGAQRLHRRRPDAATPGRAGRPRRGRRAGRGTRRCPAAVTGPMPSIVSSCSTVALPRLIGPSSRAGAATAAAPARPALGHDDLLAVGEPRGEVDRFQHRAAGAAPPARSTASVTRAPGRQPVDARAAAPRRSRRRRRRGRRRSRLKPPPSADGRRRRAGRERTARRRPQPGSPAPRPAAGRRRRRRRRATWDRLSSGMARSVAGRGARVARANRTIQLQAQSTKSSSSS